MLSADDHCHNGLPPLLQLRGWDGYLSTPGYLSSLVSEFFFQLGAEPGGASKVDEDNDLPLDADKDVPVEAGSFVMGPACRRYDV